MPASLKKNQSVAIIGAGCSGITAIKCLTEAGIGDVTCFESNDRIGGNWVYSEDPSHSSVCETTHLISSKTLSSFSDFPMPDSYPDYPSHEQVLAYFESYCDKFGLREYIRFNTRVEKAEPTDDGGWSIRTSDGQTRTFDYLLIANGHHSVPRHPALPGNFTGEYLHSHLFKNNRPFRDKRVLVIGAGNSGADCAVECSRTASITSISIRRPHYIVPKFVMGQPADVYNEKMNWIPDFILNPLRKWSLRFMIGPYQRYGLPEPDFGVTEDHPTLSSELLDRLRHGKISVRSAIKKIDGKEITFDDGTTETYDVIIAATGYKIATPFLDPGLLDYSEADSVELYLRMFHPELPSLIFIGLVQPQGAIWPLSEVQSQLAALYIHGKWKVPPDLREKAADEARRIAREFLPAKRHTIEVDFHRYKKQVEKEIARAG